MTRTAINTITILALGLTGSQTSWAHESAEVSMQNSTVILETLPMGDGTCILDVEAFATLTNQPSDPYLQVGFQVESIVVTGGDQTMELLPNFEQEPGCEEVDGSLICGPTTVFFSDGIEEVDGAWVGYSTDTFEFYESVSTPTGISTYGVKQYTMTPNGKTLRQKQAVTLDCPCWYRWDLNEDGLVSIADYIDLLSIYGQNVEGTSNDSLDIDGNGLIDMTEMMDFLTQFGASC